MELKEYIIQNNSTLLGSEESKLSFETFKQQGFPTTKNEEWKYTSVKEIVSEEYTITHRSSYTEKDIQKHFLHDKDTQVVIVFVNGVYSETLSKIDVKDVSIHKSNSDIFKSQRTQFHQYKKYNQDGFIALNDSFLDQGIFIHIPKNKAIESPIYLYYINDTRAGNALALPHTTILLEENAQASFVEIFIKRWRKHKLN